MFTFVFSDIKMEFSIPNRTISHLETLIENILSSTFVTPKQISRIAGHIISMSLAIGPITNLFTRQMYTFIESRIYWNTLYPLNECSLSEIYFWNENFNNSNGFKIKMHAPITKIVFSDATAYGYGGFIVEQLGEIIGQGFFDNEDKTTSSTCPEHIAVRYLLTSFYSALKNQDVLWFTDNINVSKIVKVGSKKDQLQKIAIEIFNECIRNNIKLYFEWIPREMNSFADQLSKIKDTDDWSTAILIWKFDSNDKFKKEVITTVR